MENTVAINKQNNKYYSLLFWSCFLLILSSMTTKLAYTSQLVSIIDDFGTTKADAALGMTFYYLIYGISQIFVALLMKKLNMRFFIVVTTVVSITSFAFVAVSTRIWHMWLIMGLNGILQSGVYGGCIYYLGRYLPDEWSGRVAKMVSATTVMGGMLTYALGAVFVELMSWKATFIFFDILLALSLLLFCVSLKTVQNKVGRYIGSGNKKEEVANVGEGLINKMSARKVYGIFFCTVFLALVINCGYYGVNTWVPNLLKDVHQLSDSISLLITTLLPTVTYFGSSVAIDACEKRNNYFAVSTFFVIWSALICIALALTYDKNIIVALLLSALYLFLVRGVGIVMTTFIPLKMKHIIDAGKTSLFSNAAASLGASVMPFISGLVMDKLGWSSYYIVICGVTVAFALMLGVCALVQGKKRLFD